MKIGPVIKLNKRNKTTSRKFNDDIMSAICDLILIFPIYDRFGAIQKPDSGQIVCKSYIFINSNHVPYKN